MKKDKKKIDDVQLAAFHAFNSRDYQKAYDLYKEIINFLPNDIMTQYNIAASAQQIGQFEEAKKYYEKYLKVKKEDVKALNNLGVIALQENDIESAKTYFLKAISFDKNYLSAYSNLSQIYIQEENVIAASNLLSSYPIHHKNGDVNIELFQSYCNIANVYFNKKDYLSASNFFLQALECAPKEYEEKLNQYLAGCMIEKGDIEELQKYALRAYELNPSDPVNIYHLGVYYFRSSNYDQARIYFTNVIETNPESTLYLSALANLNIETEEYDAALNVIKKALELEPESVYILNTYGRVYLLQGMYDRALELFLKAFNRDQNNSFTLANVGTAYMSLNIMQEAKNYLLKSLKLNPKEQDALVNMGQISYKQGEYLDAINWFQLAREYYPDLIIAHQNLAVMYLGLFEFNKGWEEYRYRKIDKFNPHLIFNSGHMNLPDNLTGKRILLRHEQGLGDEIFFLRFITILKERGAWIAYFPNPKLFEVLSLCPHIDYLVKEKETIASIDYDIFIGDLPRLLKIHSSDMIPPPLTLFINENVKREIEEEFTVYTRPLIGITWKAGIQRFNFLSKDVSLTDLISLLKEIDATFIILQRNPTEDEIYALKQAFGNRVIDASGYNNDLTRMIALLSILDIYITVSNTNVHLAASIGKKCHILVPFPPDWRWGYNAKQVSPWFPDFKTYHQSSYMGDWDEGLQMLIDDVKKDLDEIKEFEQFRMIINESILKVEELIAYKMYEDAQRLCEKLLILDKSNNKVLVLLCKVLLSTHQYEELEKTLDMFIVS